MSPSANRSRLRSRTRAAVSLVALGLASVPLVGWSHAVEVAVDGDVLHTRTYATTVGGVLDELGLGLGPADQVIPARDVPLEQVDTIDIDRAITVDVAIAGAVVRRVTAPVGSVAGILTEAGIDVRDDGGYSTPRWTSPIEDGDTIAVHLPRPVQLQVDGTVREVRTLATTVGALLIDAGIELGPDDTVDWDLAAPVMPGSNVTVERVAFDEVVEDVRLERDEVERQSGDLERGERRVETEGSDGLRRDTYRVERVDGDEVHRELIDSEVVREPVGRVVLVGTAAPHPPPAPAPKPAPAPRARSAPGDDVWDRLARCESGGNWATRGTYHGGLQFHPDTWRANKPAGAPTYAYEATREQQIEAGRWVQRSQGWEAWPHCSRQIGVR